MKLVYSNEELAFIDTFNSKVAIWGTLKSFFEANILSDAGTKLKADLEVYINTNQDKWVELQAANNT